MKAKSVCAFFFLSVSCQFFSLVCCWSAVCGCEREEGVRRGEMLGEKQGHMLRETGKEDGYKKIN